MNSGSFSQCLAKNSANEIGESIDSNEAILAPIVFLAPSSGEAVVSPDTRLIFGDDGSRRPPVEMIVQTAANDIAVKARAGLTGSPG